MGLTEDLLVQALNGLREDVQALQGKQDTMKDELHAAILDNTVKTTALEGKVKDLDTGMRHFKTEVRKEARRWGAVGGFCSTAVAIVAALVKSLLRFPHA